MANKLSGQVKNATRVRTLADALLRSKFGSGGSHNRLIRSSKLYRTNDQAKSEKSIEHTPRIDPDFLSIDFPK